MVDWIKEKTFQYSVYKRLILGVNTNTDKVRGWKKILQTNEMTRKLGNYTHFRKNRSFSRWQRNKTWRSPLLPQDIKIHLACGMYYRALSESWQKPQTSKKGKNKVGQDKDEKKRELKFSGQRSALQGRDSWRKEVFQTFRNPLTGEVRRIL